MKPRCGRRRSTLVLSGVVLLCSALCGVGCAAVPQNRRTRLADPMMKFDSDALDAQRKAKFYSTREAAAGGDGAPAGGGCGCQ